MPRTPVVHTLVNAVSAADLDWQASHPPRLSFGKCDEPGCTQAALVRLPYAAASRRYQIPIAANFCTVHAQVATGGLEP
jgi:hypothetical protein